MAPKSLQSSLEWRRYDLERVNEMTVKYSVVEGTVPLQGIGEAITTINFPILFIEKPVFTFGHELAENHWAVVEQFPTVSATVAQWTYLVRPDQSKYWNGCTVAVVVGGPDALESLLHFSFAGRAFRNPVISDTGTTDTL